jgi:hypothetical protein
MLMYLMVWEKMFDFPKIRDIHVGVDRNFNIKIMRMLERRG